MFIIKVLQSIHALSIAFILHFRVTGKLEPPHWTPADHQTITELIQLSTTVHTYIHTYVQQVNLTLFIFAVMLNHCNTMSLSQSISINIC